MVDAEGLAARLERLDSLLGELEEIRAGGQAAYREEFRNRLAADRAIQLAIQICIDAGAHLVSELGLEPPSDYRGIFVSLEGAGLDRALAGRLADAAGLRTILVHGYLELDEERVWEALEHLDDLRAFAAWAIALAEE